MKKISILLIIILSYVVVFSQTVENITSEAQEGKIIIYYEIAESNPKQNFEVLLSCLVDDDNLMKPENITGDVGYVRGGKYRYTIIWDMNKEISKYDSLRFFVEIKQGESKGTRIKFPKNMQYKKWFAGYNAAPIFTPVGLRFGRTSTLWIFGGYLAARVGFWQFEGSMEYPVILYSITGGLTARIINHKKIRLNIYSGAGYGMWGGYVYSFEDGGYMLGNDDEGFEFEYGIMLSYKRLYLSSGLTHQYGIMDWWHTEATMGLGIYF